ncbi:hypothetical protein QL285_051375 [Trifolium repens]|nr:hypothetical protein QL285_051375 [Trifolium repens]
MDINADLEDLDNKLLTLRKIFEKIGKDQSGVEKAICSFCYSEFSIGKNLISDQNYGISHITRHVFLFKSLKLNLLSLEKPLIPFNQTTHRDLLAEAIIAHDLPFSFIAH